MSKDILLDDKNPGIDVQPGLSFWLNDDGRIAVDTAARTPMMNLAETIALIKWLQDCIDGKVKIVRQEVVLK